MPKKKFVAKKRKAPLALFNVADSMRKVRLPKQAFYFDSKLGHIYPLVNLTFSAAASGSCGCAKVTGQLIAAAGHLKFVNSFTADAGDVFPTLVMAIEAKRLHELREERSSYVAQRTWYGVHRQRKLAVLKEHPKLTYEALVRAELLDEDDGVTGPDSLKKVHYLTAIDQCYMSIVRRAANQLFPEVADPDVDSDD